MQAPSATTQAIDEQTPTLAEDFLAVLHHLMRDSGPRLYALVGERSLTLSHVKALHALEGRDETSVKELAECLGLSLAGTSRLVEVLVRRGFAARREDEHDRRVKRVSITADGRALLHDINAARLAGLEQFLAGLPPAERDALRTALAPIAERIRQ